MVNASDYSNECSRNSRIEPGWLPITQPLPTLQCTPNVRVVDEGDIDLEPDPAIRRWLADVEKLDGFEVMPADRQSPGNAVIVTVVARAALERAVVNVEINRVYRARSPITISGYANFNLVPHLGELFPCEFRH